MPAILHTADIHLGKPWSDMGTVAEQLSEQHWLCFERICRLAAERGAVALAISGDLFERPDPPAALVNQVAGTFKRTISEGVTVIIAPGTHDGLNSPRSVYRSEALGGALVFRNASIGETFVAERGGSAVSFQGLCWDPQETPEDFLQGYRHCPDEIPEVLMIHGDVGESGSRRSKDLPASSQQLAACGADYVALGHRHQHREFRNGDLIWGAYPGTPFGLSFKSPELGPRSVSLVEIGGPEGARIEQVSTADTQWLHVNLDLAGLNSEEELLSAMRVHAGAQQLVSFELCGAADFQFETSSLRTELAGEFAYTEIEDSSVELSGQAMESLAQEQSVRGLFIRRMRKRLGGPTSPEERSEVVSAIREGLMALSDEER